MEHKHSAAVKAYILSLKEEAARRTNVAQQLFEFPIEWEFFDAVDLRAVDAIPEFLYRPEHPGVAGRRSLTKGEVGCSASHRKIYEKILRDGVEWALVLEDDAIISLSLSEFIVELIKQPNRSVDCFIVGYSKLQKERQPMFYKFEPIQPLGKIGSFVYGRVWRNWTCGTVGYVISKKGAQKMLRSARVETLADDWHFFARERDMNIAHVRPLLVLEDFISFQSSLELERSTLTARYNARLDFLRVIRGAIRRTIMLFLHLCKK